MFLLWQYFNLIKPLPSFHTVRPSYYSQKSCDVSVWSCGKACVSHQLGCICTWRHSCLFSPSPLKPPRGLVLSRALCEPGRSAERWMILDMAYLFVYRPKQMPLSRRSADLGIKEGTVCLSLQPGSHLLSQTHTDTHTPSHVFLWLCGAPGSIMCDGGCHVNPQVDFLKSRLSYTHLLIRSGWEKWASRYNKIS